VSEIQGVSCLDDIVTLMTAFRCIGQPLRNDFKTLRILRHYLYPDTIMPAFVSGRTRKSSSIEGLSTQKP